MNVKARLERIEAVAAARNGGTGPLVTDEDQAIAQRIINEHPENWARSPGGDVMYIGPDHTCDPPRLEPLRTLPDGFVARLPAPVALTDAKAAHDRSNLDFPDGLTPA